MARAFMETKEVLQASRITCRECGLCADDRDPLLGILLGIVAMFKHTLETGHSKFELMEEVKEKKRAA